MEEEPSINYYRLLFNAVNNGKGRRRHAMGWTHNKRLPDKIVLEGAQCRLGPEFHPNTKEPPKSWLTIKYSKGPEHLRRPKVHSLRGPCHHCVDFKELCIDGMADFLPADQVEVLERFYEEEKEKERKMPDVTQKYLDDEVLL